jgi:hypothetical protein
VKSYHGYFVSKCFNLLIELLEMQQFLKFIISAVGRYSSVRTAIGYGPEGPGIESWYGRDFSHLSRPSLDPTQPPVQWVPRPSRGKQRPGRDADHSPSSAEVKKD